MQSVARRGGSMRQKRRRSAPDEQAATGGASGDANNAGAPVSNGGRVDHPDAAASPQSEAPRARHKRPRQRRGAEVARDDHGSVDESKGSSPEAQATVVHSLRNRDVSGAVPTSGAGSDSDRGRASQASTVSRKRASGTRTSRRGAQLTVEEFMSQSTSTTTTTTRVSSRRVTSSSAVTRQSSSHGVSGSDIDLSGSDGDTTATVTAVQRRRGARSVKRGRDAPDHGDPNTANGSASDGDIDMARDAPNGTAGDTNGRTRRNTKRRRTQRRGAPDAVGSGSSPTPTTTTGAPAAVPPSTQAAATTPGVPSGSSFSMEPNELGVVVSHHTTPLPDGGYLRVVRRERIEGTKRITTTITTVVRIRHKVLADGTVVEEHVSDHEAEVPHGIVIPSRHAPSTPLLAPPASAPAAAAPTHPEADGDAPAKPRRRSSRRGARTNRTTRTTRTTTLTRSTAGADGPAVVEPSAASSAPRGVEVVEVAYTPPVESPTMELVLGSDEEMYVVLRAPPSCPCPPAVLTPYHPRVTHQGPR